MLFIIDAISSTADALAQWRNVLSARVQGAEMFNALKNLFGGKKHIDSSQTLTKPAPPRFEEEEREEFSVPEITARSLIERAKEENAPLILDVREAFEFKQTRVQVGGGIDLLHIPMNSVPNRLAEIPSDREIAVICASGGRSYGVAHYLIEQGFRASNVDGGMGAWVRAGGAYEQG